jgi:hypothetical protein
VAVSSGRLGVVLAGALALVVPGCSSTEQPEVEQVATTFEDPAGDAIERCGLLVPAALEQLEQDAGAACEEAIGGLPLEGGEVLRVEVWGGDAQVRLDGDTVFLTKTSAGWRVAAALCSPRPEGPYDCGLEGS